MRTVFRIVQRCGCRHRYAGAGLPPDKRWTGSGFTWWRLAEDLRHRHQHLRCDLRCKFELKPLPNLFSSLIKRCACLILCMKKITNITLNFNFTYMAKSSVRQKCRELIFIYLFIHWEFKQNLHKFSLVYAVVFKVIKDYSSLEKQQLKGITKNPKSSWHSCSSWLGWNVWPQLWMWFVFRHDMSFDGSCALIRGGQKQVIWLRHVI